MSSRLRAIARDTVEISERGSYFTGSREVPIADAVHNVAHASLLVLGLERADLSLVARGLSDRLHQDRRARLAIEIFSIRVRKYVGAYLARMNGADALIFTGGIGENAAELRQRICGEMDFLGIALDPDKNAEAAGGKEAEVSAAGSRVAVWVIPTNEELLIARDTVRCVRDAPRRW